MKPPYYTDEAFESVVRVASLRTLGESIACNAGTNGGGLIQIQFRHASPHVWHYRVSVVPDGGEAYAPLIQNREGNGERLQIEESSSSITLRSSSSAMHLGRNPWSMRLTRKSGEAILSESQADVDGFGRPFVPPLGFLRLDGNIREIVQSFHVRPDEHLYGLGEKFTSLDKKGQRIVGWNVDALGSTSERSHKNVPLLLSTRGYGLFVNTSARVDWDIAASSCQSYTVKVHAPVLDVFIIIGENLAAILDHYTDLTGRPPVPPKWSFGLWVSSGGTYRDRAAMEQLVAGLGTHDIPADVVHIDPWWMRSRHYCDFRWDTTAFPHPDGFIDALHSRGLRVCLWEHPYISVESDLFEEGKRKGYFLRGENGEVYVIQYGLSLAPLPDGIVRESSPENSWNAPVAIIDLTNPDAYRWFKDLHRPLLRMGVDVFKTDFGEDVPSDARFSTGESGALLHNVYPRLYNQAVFEVTKEERGYGVVWGRSGTAGSQQFPVCWSGDPAADFASLACTIRGGLSAGLSGIPFWSNDIGAYRGRPGRRLYVRWAQFGLFCSHSRMHGDSPREPWIFDEEVTGIVRRYVQLRYRLFPYTYACAHEASRTGMPVIRAMPLAFAADVIAHSFDLEYMFGPSLLVAPVYDDSNGRSVYLPEGTWVDFWSDRRVQGPGVIEVEAALEKLPLFVRAGAMLPMMRDAKRIPAGWIDPLMLEVYPGADSTYDFEEDEGDTVWTMKREGQKLVMTFSGPRSRQWVLHIHSTSPVARARCKRALSSQYEELAPVPLNERCTEISLPSSLRGSVEME